MKRRLALVAIVVVAGVAIEVLSAAQRAKGCKPQPISAAQMQMTWPKVQVVHEPDGSESVRVTLDGHTTPGSFTFECR